MTVDHVELRELVPQVVSVLVRRGADFATAEDAVQQALIRAVSAWEQERPSDPKGWPITVAWRAFLDSARFEATRRDRKVRFETDRPPGAVPDAESTSTSRGATQWRHISTSATVAHVDVAGGPPGSPQRRFTPAHLFIGTCCNGLENKLQKFSPGC